MARLRVLVLGSAAGGGFPQWNCRCPICCLAWAGDPRVTARTQSSLAVSADGKAWLLLNGSPDLRQQIMSTPALQPKGEARSTPIAGVFLTNGDVDHIGGLLSLREQQPFTLYGSQTTLSLIAKGSIFGVLDPRVVKQIPVGIDQIIGPQAGLTLRPFAVPGKVPLFLEGETVEIAETETTVGLEIAAGGKRLVYVPGCADLNAGLVARLSGADLLFFDGTTFTDDEMVRLGLSPKTAARMGHLAIDGPRGSLERLAKVQIGRKVYIHINNTNPVLVAGSPERRKVEAAGWEIAYDGMEIVL